MKKAEVKQGVEGASGVQGASRVEGARGLSRPTAEEIMRISDQGRTRPEEIAALGARGEMRFTNDENTAIIGRGPNFQIKSEEKIFFTTTTTALPQRVILGPWEPYAIGDNKYKFAFGTMGGAPDVDGADDEYTMPSPGDYVYPGIEVGLSAGGGVSSAQIVIRTTPASSADYPGIGLGESPTSLFWPICKWPGKEGYSGRNPSVVVFVSDFSCTGKTYTATFST